MSGIQREWVNKPRNYMKLLLNDSANDAESLNINIKISKKRKKKKRDVENENEYESYSFTNEEIPKKVKRKHKKFEVSDRDEEVHTDFSDRGEKKKKKRKKRSLIVEQAEETAVELDDEECNVNVAKKNNRNSSQTEDSELQHIREALFSSTGFTDTVPEQKHQNQIKNCTSDENFSTEFNPPVKKKPKTYSELLMDLSQETEGEVSVKKHKKKKHHKVITHQQTLDEAPLNAECDNAKKKKRHKTDSVSPVDGKVKKRKHKNNNCGSSEFVTQRKRSHKTSGMDLEPGKMLKKKQKGVQNNSDKHLQTAIKSADPEAVPIDSSESNIKSEVQEPKDSAPLNEFERVKKSVLNQQLEKVCTVRDDDSSSDENIEFVRSNNFPKGRNNRVQNVPLENDIKIRLEEAEENLQLTEEQIQKLKSLVITIPWDLPRAHTIETRMSSLPTPEQRELFKQVPLKTGLFSKNEDNMIQENFQSFCKLHDLPYDPEPFLNFMCRKTMVLSKKQRIDFVRYLGRGLNDRMLNRIYKRFQLLYKKLRKGRTRLRFSPEEDEIILQAVSRYTNPFAVVAKILNRSRIYIMERYHMLTINDVVKWDLERMQQLVQTIQNVTKVQNVEELKDRKISLTEWQQVAAQMKINPRHIKRCWYMKLYPGLFTEKTQEFIFRADLIDRLIEMKVDDWRLIDWKELSKFYEGTTDRLLAERIRKQVRRLVPKDQRSDVQGCLKVLKDAFQRHQAVERRHKHRFAFENGRLVRVQIEI